MQARFCFALVFIGLLEKKNGLYVTGCRCNPVKGLDHIGYSCVGAEMVEAGRALWQSWWKRRKCIFLSSVFSAIGVAVCTV